MFAITLIVLLAGMAAVFVWMCMTVFVPEPVAEIVIEPVDDSPTY